MTRKQFVFVLFFILICVGSLTFFYGGCNETKEFKIEEKEINKKEKSLEKKIESVKIDTTKISKSKEIVKNKKATRNEERIVITYLNDDEQVQYMSNWISEIDTIGRKGGGSTSSISN